MSRKVLAGIVAVVVLALAVWLVPTAFGSSGTTARRRRPPPTAASAHAGAAHGLHARARRPLRSERARPA